MFTGYAKRPQPRWPYILIATVVFLLLLTGFIIFISSESTVPKVETTTTTTTTTSITTSITTLTTLTPTLTVESQTREIWVERIGITSGVDNRNQPVDNLSKVSSKEGGLVYCYTRIHCSPPQVVRHVWFDPDGREFAEIRLNISTSSQDTWSYVSLYGARTGKWQVQVKTEKNEIVAKRDFIVY